MNTFTQWLENNWFDFHRERGNIPVGHITAPKFPSIPLEEVPEIKDIHDLKMLHDRILDNHKVSPLDLSRFLDAAYQIMPNDPSFNASELRTTWRDMIKDFNNLHKPKGIIDDRLRGVRLMFIRIRELMKDIDSFIRSSRNEELVHFLRETSKMIRSLLVPIGHDTQDWKDQAADKRINNRIFKGSTDWDN